MFFEPREGRAMGRLMPSAFIDQHREQIQQIASRHGARNVRVFGSAPSRPCAKCTTQVR